MTHCEKVRVFRLYSDRKKTTKMGSPTLPDIFFSWRCYLQAVMCETDSSDWKVMACRIVPSSVGFLFPLHSPLFCKGPHALRRGREAVFPISPHHLVHLSLGLSFFNSVSHPSSLSTARSRLFQISLQLDCIGSKDSQVCSV